MSITFLGLHMADDKQACLSLKGQGVLGLTSGVIGRTGHQHVTSSSGLTATEAQ